MEKYKNIFKPSIYVAIIVDDDLLILPKALMPKDLSIWLQLKVHLQPFFFSLFMWFPNF